MVIYTEVRKKECGRNLYGVGEGRVVHVGGEGVVCAGGIGDRSSYSQLTVQGWRRPRRSRAASGVRCEELCVGGWGLEGV